MTERERRAGRLVLKGMILDGSGRDPFSGYVVIERGRIAKVYAEEETAAGYGHPDEAADAPLLDFSSSCLTPGLIDIHLHGGAGADVMDGSASGLIRMLRYYLAHGTTSILATTLTASKPDIDRALAAAFSVRQTERIGQVIQGIHLEGPFLSPKWPGAQHPQWLCNPQTAWLREWTSRFPGFLRMLTLAPELEGAQEAVAFALEQNIIAACGHSDATYDQVRTAIGWGISHAVHCCNAMRPFHHREPGVVGAVLLHDELSTEINVDGYHLHPAAVELIVRLKQDRVCVITDSMRAAGMTDGVYHLAGLEVHVKEGAARFADGTIAGSTIPLAQSVRNLVQTHGKSLPEAVKHATSIPAGIAKLHNKGLLKAGYDADLIVLEPEQLQVKRVMLGGDWFDPESNDFV
ncbi:N-acetylglucosamine-6-phosphate deacetylase [Paenibacillus ehimensis]|uniref:N-acetylglucosamine-6-phosphate deacetylase n=1 Tax=Paenibacillus ehimensis TaxID=79264 RepID=UPI003D2731E2